MRRLSSVTAALALVLGAVPAVAQVQTQELQALDLWSAAGRNTGVDPTLWRGASADLAQSVLTSLADKPVTPASAALARRVLATGASAPDGAGSDTALAAARVRALIGLGDLEGASAVLARTPRPETSEGLSRAKAEIALLTGRDEDACDTGRALQENRDAPWWLRLRAYCHVVAGEGPAAQVTLDLWRGQGGKAPAFERLMLQAITGGAPAKAAPLKASLADPLDYALSRRLKLDLAPALASASTPALVAVARDAEASRAVRLDAAARASRLGALPVEEVRAIYTPADAAAAPVDLAAAMKDAGPAGEAALSTLAAQTGDPGVRLQATGALLARGKTPTDFQALARLAQPRIAELVAAGVRFDDPALFASAAAAAGDVPSARAIRGQIQNQGAQPNTGALDLALLDALIATAAGERSGPVLDRVIERGTVGDAKARARPQAAALLLASTGAPMTPAARRQLGTFDVPQGKTTPARLTALYDAAGHALKGETALYTLSIAVQQGPALPVADRAAMLGAMGEAGLYDDARALAVEGLLAQQTR